MIVIDNVEYEVLDKRLVVDPITVNGIDGYDVCLSLKFIDDNGVHGYFNFAAGYESSNDINKFLNRSYKGKNLENDGQNIWFEIFDTKKFLDSEIESDISLVIGDLVNDLIHVELSIDDENISVSYDDKVNYIENIDEINK